MKSISSKKTILLPARAVGLKYTADYPGIGVAMRPAEAKVSALLPARAVG